MDSLIKHFDGVEDGDLFICWARGVAYQRDMTAERVRYDDAYYDKVWNYERGEIARRVNAGRCEFVRRHVKHPRATLLDWGSGSGAFLRAAQLAALDACGFEVLKEAEDRLRAVGRFADDPHRFDAVTCWDVLEHMEDPASVFKRVKPGAHVFASLPVFRDLRQIRDSKHYRPGEHLYYFTPAGFIAWMGMHGFRFLEESAHEVEAGREAIGAFAFVKDLPGYHEHIAAYQEMHSTRFYGSSSTELHLDDVAGVVRALKPGSILDYGCGRSDIAAHFYLDGARRIARYDPAIPTFATMPEGEFDLVLCCDVMEHVPIASVERVLREVRGKGVAALFTISTKPARAKLPDGRNAHVTLLTHSEWARWIADVYGSVDDLLSKWEHELVLLAGAKVSGVLRWGRLENAPCECGGEVQLESYDRPGRPVEWFMRCRVCGGRGPSAPNEQGAHDVWTGKLFVKAAA